MDSWLIWTSALAAPQLILTRELRCFSVPFVLTSTEIVEDAVLPDNGVALHHNGFSITSAVHAPVVVKRIVNVPPISGIGIVVADVMVTLSAIGLGSGAGSMEDLVHDVRRHMDAMTRIELIYRRRFVIQPIRNIEVLWGT